VASDRGSGFQPGDVLAPSTCLAPKARSHTQPGATPQDLNQYHERALKARFCSFREGRAPASPVSVRRRRSSALQIWPKAQIQSAPQVEIDTAPLALKTYLDPRPNRSSSPSPTADNPAIHHRHREKEFPAHRKDEEQGAFPEMLIFDPRSI